MHTEEPILQYVSVTSLGLQNQSSLTMYIYTNLTLGYALHSYAAYCMLSLHKCTVLTSVHTYASTYFWHMGQMTSSVARVLSAAHSASSEKSESLSYCLRISSSAARQYIWQCKGGSALQSCMYIGWRGEGGLLSWFSHDKGVILQVPAFDC